MCEANTGNDEKFLRNESLAIRLESFGGEVLRVWPGRKRGGAEMDNPSPGAREARYWLGVALHAGYAAEHDIPKLQQESTEIIAILQASQNTVRANLDS